LGNVHNEEKLRRSGDDYDERSALGIVLSFDNPSIDPEEISRRLGVQPSMAAIAGSHYVDVQGDELPPKHRTSKWRLHRYFLPSAPGLDDVPSAIADVLTMLEQHADFVMRLADEGQVSIWLQFNGADHRGIALPFDLLRRMERLHVDFGIEIFPHGLS
jgi:hypothetical protein